MQKNIKIYDFYSDFFEKNCVPYVCSKISLSYNDLLIPLETTHCKTHKKAKINSIELVPDYLDIYFDKSLQFSKVFQKYGYAINLSQHTSLENFIAAQLKSSYKKNLSRSIKKLETCFNITYKFYYGNINKDDYYNYMNVLHQMLMARFDERNDRNIVLENWEHYLNNTYELIIRKKASLFVVSSDNESIGFSLNYHYNSLIYSAIASYNLNYSKFSIGNIIIYKLIDWCFLNGVVFLDMGYGDLSHKRLWCNMTYNFNNYIVYKSENILTYFYITFKKIKFKLINFLIKKNINRTYRNLKNYVLKKKKLNVLSYHVLNNDSVEKDLYQININDDKYNFIKKIVYEFLYSNNVHINNVQVFALDKEKIYIIKGTTNQIKIKID